MVKVMDILCIDIGGGTQDICCYNGKDSFENSFKMVMPTPAKRIASQIRNLKEDIFIDGTIIGGGIFDALKEKLDNGFSVFISQKAAHSIRDNIEQVKKYGFTVVEAVINPNITFNEFDDNIIIPAADKALNGFKPQVISIAVQDHGYIENKSDRVTRFEFLKSFIKNGLENAFYDDFDKIPAHMSRLKAVYNSVYEKYPESKICVTDTAVIACLGASTVAEKNEPFITIDIGNCHTFAAAFNKEHKIIGFFEHHTHSLSKDTVIKYIDSLAAATIDHENIYKEEGHGAFLFEKQNISGCKVYITGPNRQNYIEENDRFIYADPKGDNMMTGPVGMLIQQGVKIL